MNNTSDASSINTPFIQWVNANNQMLMAVTAVLSLLSFLFVIWLVLKFSKGMNVTVDLLNFGK